VAGTRRSGHSTGWSGLATRTSNSSAYSTGPLPSGHGWVRRCSERGESDPTPPWNPLDGGGGLATWAIATDALEYELTPDAIDLGLDSVLPPILELESQIGEFGRGERASVSLTPHMVPREGPARLLFEGPHLIETDFRSSTSG